MLLSVNKIRILQLNSIIWHQIPNSEENIKITHKIEVILHAEATRNLLDHRVCLFPTLAVETDVRVGLLVGVEVVRGWTPEVSTLATQISLLQAPLAIPMCSINLKILYNDNAYFSSKPYPRTVCTCNPRPHDSRDKDVHHKHNLQLCHLGCRCQFYDMWESGRNAWHSLYQSSVPIHTMWPCDSSNLLKQIVSEPRYMRFKCKMKLLYVWNFSEAQSSNAALFVKVLYGSY